MVNRQQIEFLQEECFGAVVLGCSSHVLLIQPRRKKKNKKVDDVKWALPKGHSFPGETPLQAALREVNEETGLGLSEENFVKGFWEKELYCIEGKKMHKDSWKLQPDFPDEKKRPVITKVEKVVSYGIATIDELREPCVQKEEVDYAGWFPLQEARNMLTKPSQGLVLEKLLFKFLGLDLRQKKGEEKQLKLILKLTLHRTKIYSVWEIFSKQQK